MNDTLLTFVPPDFIDTKGERRLMIWRELGVWLVMDPELFAFAEKFDGTATVEAAIAAHGKEWQKDSATVHKEAALIIPEMVRRQVLRPVGRPVETVEEPLSIANITLNLTNRCNLKCSFCYNRDRKTEEAPIEQIARFIAQGKSAMTDDAAVIVLGGEPFLQPERLLSFLRRAPELIAKPPMVSTNGTRLTKELAAQLKEVPVEVQVSLDSADPAVHDKGRGDGVFRRALGGVERLVEAGIHTILSMVFTSETVGGIEPFLDLAAQLGVDEARFIPLRSMGASADANALARPDLMIGLEILLDVLKRKPEHARFLGRDFFSIAMVQCARSASRVSCGIGRRVIFIDADGALYPCPNHVDDTHRLGHVNTISLQEVLRESSATEALRARYHVDRYTKCAECPFKRWCAGDCRGEVLSMTSDPAAPSPYCESIQAMYTRILRLLAQGDPRATRLAGALSADAAVKTFLT